MKAVGVVDAVGLAVVDAVGLAVVDAVDVAVVDAVGMAVVHAVGVAVIRGQNTDQLVQVATAVETRVGRRRHLFLLSIIFPPSSLGPLGFSLSQFSLLCLTRASFCLNNSQ